MTFLVVASLLVQVIFIAVLIARDILLPWREAFSMRSLFLGGFLVFQSGSAIFTLLTDEVDVVGPNNMALAGLKFSAIGWLFLILFLYFYSRAGPVIRFANRPLLPVAPADFGLLAIGVSSVLAGLVMRDLMGEIPVIGVLTVMLSSGCFAAGVGCAAWGLIRDPLNPIKLVVGGITIVGTCLILLQNAFSRRTLVAAVLSLLISGYFARWRFQTRRALLLQAVLILVLGFAFIALQSATRGEKGRGGTIAEYLDAFRKVNTEDIIAVTMSVASGQFAGVNSMWIVENYPSQHPYWYLHSLRYFITQPIPRVVWAGKPWSLGNEMVHQIAVSGVKRDEFSLGPGIVGHIVADMPYIALPLYAFLIAWVTRYLDERLVLHSGDPFVVIPIGAAASQILGMPRGELGLFGFNALAWTIGAWLVMRPFRSWMVTPVVDDDEENELSRELSA